MKVEIRRESVVVRRVGLGEQDGRAGKEGGHDSGRIGSNQERLVMKASVVEQTVKRWPGWADGGRAARVE